MKDINTRCRTCLSIIVKLKKIHSVHLDDYINKRAFWNKKFLTLGNILTGL